MRLGAGKRYGTTRTGQLFKIVTTRDPTVGFGLDFYKLFYEKISLGGNCIPKIDARDLVVFIIFPMLFWILL